jgi:hypothetical protein
MSLKPFETIFFGQGRIKDLDHLRRKILHRVRCQPDMRLIIVGIFKHLPGRGISKRSDVEFQGFPIGTLTKIFKCQTA